MSAGAPGEAPRVDNPAERPRLRGGTVVVLCALAIGLGGVLVGTQATHRTVQERRQTLAERADAPGLEAPRAARTEGAAAAAVRWDELPGQRRGANAGFVNSLDKLTQPELTPETYDGRAERLAATRVRRAERRAFDGAPPMVPHTIDERAATACLACHGEGLVVMGRVAPRMSHALHTQCTQCHVPMDRPMLEDAAAPPVDSAWVGLGTGPGDRFQPDAPPTTPHGTFMRHTCVSCHGPLGPPGLRTTHPERQSCLQCHATSHPLEQELGAR